MGAAESFGWVDRRCADVPVGRDRRGAKSRRVGDKKMNRTLADWLYRYRWWPWVVAIPILAITVVPSEYARLRFTLWPVAEMQGELVGRKEDAAIIHIYGKKLRGLECTYLGITAFADRVVGLPVDLNIRRLDKAETGVTRPSGTFDLGLWEVHPVMGATKVRVYTAHNCEGVKIATLVAEVKL